MRKILFSVLFLVTAIFTTQGLFANETFYLNKTKVSSNNLQLEISDLKSSGLKQMIEDRLGTRDIKDVKKITVTSGEISNSDFKFISEEIVNLEELDLSNANFSEKEILVTFNKKSKIGDFQFPKSKDGYKLAENFFKDNRKIEKVELNGVTSLGESVFENTQKIRSIDLSKVDTLNDRVFMGSGIESIVFSKSYDLPKEFFKDTKQLTNIDISNAKTIGEGVFFNSNIEFVKMPSSYALESYTFAKTKNLVRVDLSGATRLGEGDFKESNIEEVIFPAEYALPDYYFSKTLKLKEIDISKAKDIGAGVFAFSNIEKVTFPNEFKLSEGLFQYTEKINNIDVSNAKEFKEAIFAGSSLSKIIMPERFEVTKAMFGFMENLTSIDLSGAEFLGSNIIIKSGSNYDYYRKFFDGSDLVSNIKTGIETIILGGVVPSVSTDTFSNLNNNPPVIFLPKSKEWDGLSNNIIDKNNEIETALRYDSYTYKDLMISKDTSIQIGFVNPAIISKDEEKPNVKYQWFFNDKEIYNGNQSIFTVDNFSANDEGAYRLEVIVDSKVYRLFDISLEANELSIDPNTLYKGFFLNEKIEESTVNVLYVKDEIRETLNMEDLEYTYDFSEVGNTSVQVKYTKDDLIVVADYPVKVANSMPNKIKLKTGKTYEYDPMIDGFEFILTANQKEFFDIIEKEDSSEIIISAKNKYKGQLDFKFNDRVGQVEIEIANNLFWLWVGLGATLLLVIATMVYLRLTKGMFKIKKINKNKKNN